MATKHNPSPCTRFCQKTNKIETQRCTSWIRTLAERKNFSSLELSFTKVKNKDWKISTNKIMHPPETHSTFFYNK